MVLYDDLPGKDIDIYEENESLYSILQLLNYQKNLCMSKGVKPIHPYYFAV